MNYKTISKNIEVIKLLKKSYKYISILDVNSPKKYKVENFEKLFNKSKKSSHFNCLIF